MSSKTAVPRPRAIDRSKLTYIRDYSPAKVEVPSIPLIDRSKVTYLGGGNSRIEVPKATLIDRSKINYLGGEKSKIKVPAAPLIDRSKITYLGDEKAEKIAVPRPASINREALVYLSGEVPKARKIDREKITYLRPEPSVLEKNVLSPETPGSGNFPPFQVTPELEEKAAQRIAQYPDDQRRSAVLPLLHEVQHRHGFISPESIDWVAGKLDIAPIKVVEVVTFYPGFRQKAPGKIHFRVCRTLSCAMGGSYELMAKLCELTGTDRSDADGHSDPISVSPCGNYSVEYAECLASCGTAPVCLVNDDFHEGITPEKAQDLIDQYQQA